MQKVDKKGLGNQIPPHLFHVEIYFEANGSTMASAQQFMITTKAVIGEITRMT